MENFQLGSVTLYAFGVITAVAAGLALLWTVPGARGRVKPSAVSWFATLAVPMALIGARLLLCVVSQGWWLFRQNFFFDFNRGGYLTYGCVAGVLAAGWIAAKLTGEKASRMTDAAAAPLMLFIGLCRLGEGLMGGGYGRNIVEFFDPYAEQSMIAWEEPDFLCRFPFAVQDHYGEWCFAIFMLEAIAALIIAFMVSRKAGRDGGKTARMLLLFAAWQVLFVSMRVEGVVKWGFVRVEQLLSGVVLAGVLIAACVKAGKRVSRGRKIAAWIGMLACMGIVMAMEFAIEQKIAFLNWMRIDLCYIVMTAACAGIIAFAGPVVKTAYFGGKPETPTEEEHA